MRDLKPNWYENGGISKDRWEFKNYGKSTEYRVKSDSWGKTELSVSKSWLTSTNWIKLIGHRLDSGWDKALSLWGEVWK